MTKRETALNVIRYEYATYGHETKDSTRASIESGVSYEAYLKAVSEGLKIFNKRGDK